MNLCFVKGAFCGKHEKHISVCLMTCHSGLRMSFSMTDYDV